MTTVCAESEERPTVLCQERRRALALIDRPPSGFGGIARHPEVGRHCRICDHGGAANCPGCLCSETLALHARLLEAAGWESQTIEDLERQEQDCARWRDEVAQLDPEHPGLGATTAAALQPVPLSWAHVVGR